MKHVLSNNWRHKAANIISNEVFWGIAIVTLCMSAALIGMHIYESTVYTINIQ